MWLMFQKSGNELTTVLFRASERTCRKIASYQFQSGYADEPEN